MNDIAAFYCTVFVNDIYCYCLVKVIFCQWIDCYVFVSLQCYLNCFFLTLPGYFINFIYTRFSHACIVLTLGVYIHMQTGSSYLSR
jgi:hypothetical protein